MKEKNKKNKTKTKKEVKTSKIKSFLNSLSDNTSKLNRVDVKIMLFFAIIYGIMAFTNLGTTKNPKTYHEFKYSGEEVALEFTGETQHISKIRYYTGAEVGKFTIMISTDGNEYHNLKDFETHSVFTWEETEIDSDMKYIRFVAEDVGSYLGDIQAYDKYGNKIVAKAANDQSESIADELDTVPVQINHKNSAYFDEVYFARSAYEYTHGKDAMEWTHPPLGKLLIALPVLLFGMTPFAFRFMGALAGLLMIPVIYILAKRLFKGRKWAILAGLLMMFDNFHFAHTRMATVDSFLVLFILLATLFMKQYVDLEKDAPIKEKRKYLLLSGLFMGCSIATKWTGLYAALALAIVFFMDIFKEREDNRKKRLNYSRASKIALFGMVILSLVPIIIYYVTTMLASSAKATGAIFWYYFAVVIISLLTLIILALKKDKNLRKTFIICVIAFILIPIVIYALSYMLFPNVHGYTNNSISGIFNQIKDMFNYHSTLADRHEFESNWYQWPIMYKPVWYYVGYHGGNLKSTIVGIGNPIIWWFGLVGVFFTVIKTLFKREKESAFILIFALCTFLPYVFIGRTMFMYHYFPTLPFVMLAIVALIKWITEKIKNNSFYIFYVLLVIVIFFVFYPVTSGIVTTNDYIDSLKWLSSWIF